MGDRKVFEDSVIPLPDEPGPTAQGLAVQPAEPDNRNEQMRVLFSLEIPPKHQAELEERVARGEVVPVDELQQKYAADQADCKKLVAWLKRQHFDVTEVSPDGTSVYTRASVAQIEKSLGVDMVRVTKEGLTYTAAKNAPSLPSDVAKSVHAIIGLQPFRQMHKHSRTFTPPNGNRMSLSAPAKRAGGRDRAAARTGAATLMAEAAATDIPNTPPYKVAEVLKAYGADGLGATGQGQTIAILIDTQPAEFDVQNFWTENGLPNSPSRIEVINVNDVFLPPLDSEVSLDVQWSSGIAPGANVRVYAAGTLENADIDRALDAIIADLPSYPGMRQVSISLGLGEIQQLGADELQNNQVYPNGYVRTQHAKFLKLAAAGVNVFVSSGDDGSRPPGPQGPFKQVQFGSSDPYVIAVGGTTLVLSADGAVASEVGWAGSGGGESIFFVRQPWQTGAGVPAGTDRLVPDVSLTADPQYGAYIVSGGQPQQIGGTSWSAPVWAGFCALINEARAKAGKPFLPFLSPLIYPLMGTACFRDITAGTNGDYTAGSGYDMVTGIGVPNVAELIKALTSPSA
jgi:kumamolisin